MQNHVLVAGGSGVIGAAAVEHFAALPAWSATALSRSAPVLTKSCPVSHCAADLTDAAACAAAVSMLPAVSHLIYAAVAESADLVSGWTDDAVIEANGRMFANILDPLSAAHSLRHVVLLQGTKAYGAHRHAVEVPAREDRPRDDHANFYFLQEDHLRRRAGEAGFAFTIFRPQILVGSAPGAAMNPVAAIGAYIALCAELGRTCACPGQSAGLLEIVDTGLLAQAFAWSFSSRAAAGQVFNITNGDVLVLRHAWPNVAAELGFVPGGEPPTSLGAFFADPVVLAAWAQLAARHRLRLPDLAAVLGKSHHYMDLLFGPRLAERSLPVLLSTIKLRQAGFAECRDSVASLVFWLRRMVELKLLPPLNYP